MYVPTIENALVPVVVEQSSRGERSFDIFHVFYVSASFS
jgi:ATP-dependent Clp protease protease subunit